MRTLLAILLAACSGPAKQPPASTADPTSPSPAPTEPRPASPPAPVADATPDAPSGDAAKRDAELGQKAAAFIDAFTNNAAEYTPDGKRLVMVSNRDGVPQLYVADATRPASPVTRLIQTTERVASIAVTPDGKSVVFRSDTGANELWSIFRVGLDGKGLVDLTPGEPLERDPAILPEGTPGTMFFSARKMSEQRSAVYSASTATPGPAKALYTDDGPAELSAVSRDGKTLLVTQFPSQSEMAVLRVDAATGKAIRLFPADATKLTVHFAGLSADDRLVYVATDNGGEQTVVLALEATTGKVAAKYAVSPAYAAVNNVSIARRGGLIAVSVIAGNHAEIRLLDGKRLTEKVAVKLPLGQGGAGEFSADGKRLVAVWSTPRTPTDVFAIDTATGAVEPLRKEDRPTLASMPALEASSVEIPAFDGGRIPINVYVVKGEEQKPHPVIVMFHGGPAGVSTIRWSAATAYFASLGYAIVEPNVRGSAGYGRAFEAGDNGPKRADAFKDVEASARWVAKQPWADKDRLVVYGSSYGGYTTLTALSRWPDIWRAGVDLVGIANLKTFMATTSGVIRKLFLVEFGDPDKDGDLLMQQSPITGVDKIVDPTFVYAGANDPRVPRSESDLIVKALRQRRVPTEYMVADNEGHSLARRETQLAFYARCARFLEAHLR